MTRTTMATIKPGQIVKVGYSRPGSRRPGLQGLNVSQSWAGDPCEFVGFESGARELTAPGKGEMFDTYRQLKAAQPDQDLQSATFLCLDDGSYWQAYRYNGRWVVGTSADPIRLSSI